MATISVVLRNSRADKKGLSPLMVRISDGQTHRTRSLKEKVRASAWNADKQEVRAKHPEATRINAVIAQAKAEAAQVQKQLRWEDRDLSASELAEEMWNEKPVAVALDFFAFADTWADRLRAEERINYHKRAKAVIKKLRDTVGGPLPFDQFDSDVLERHYRRMTDDLGNSANTANVSFVLIRTIVRKAIKEGVITPSDDPFWKFTRPKATKVDKTRLTAGQVQDLRDLSVSGDLAASRDLFLFACYAAGTRFGDAVSLRWRNIKRDGDTERLAYQMSKTGALNDFELHPQAVKILDRYRLKTGSPDPDDFIFPHLKRYRKLTTATEVQKAIGSRNVVVNRHLKELAKLAEIHEHLTFHVSRHTFANLARQNGAGVYEIQSALRQSSLRETATYLNSFSSDSAGLAIEAAFGKG